MLVASGDNGVNNADAQPMTDEKASPPAFNPSGGGTGMEGMIGQGISALVTLCECTRPDEEGGEVTFSASRRYPPLAFEARSVVRGFPKDKKTLLAPSSTGRIGRLGRGPAVVPMPVRKRWMLICKRHLH